MHVASLKDSGFSFEGFDIVLKKKWEFGVTHLYILKTRIQIKFSKNNLQIIDSSLAIM